MRNLLNFLAKYNHLFVFLVLEGFALYLLGTSNDYHNTRFVRGFRGFTAGIEKRVSNARSYFHLREISQSLSRENAQLKTTVEQLTQKGDNVFIPVYDTISHQRYTYTSAEVVNNSVNRQKNFFTINKGRMQGMSVDMAVISDDRVAGVIIGCSDNFSVAMSLLNIDFRLSARLKSNGYFGSLTWDGRDYRTAILSEIPQHVTFGLGDTIETTSYSAIFPEGIFIGTVSNFERAGGDFYSIKVALANDFKKLRFVTVAGNLMKEEQLELEKQFQ